MKFIICLIVLLVSAKECDQKKPDLALENSIELKKRMMQDSTKITYEATTRGFFLKLWIQGDSIAITEDRYLKEVRTYRLSEADKQSISDMLSSIDETALETLKPPTTTFQYDAAAMATLEVLKSDQSYKTPVFDHGKPPKPILEIVNKMLSIKSEVEKQ